MDPRAFRNPVPLTAAWIVMLALVPLVMPGSYGEAQVGPDYISRSVEQAEGLLEAAGTAYAEGRFQNALRLYSRALRLTPEESSIYLGRGMTYEMMGKTANAAKDYQTALKYDPRNYQAMENLAGILERRGKGIALAIRLYERALKLDPRPNWQENMRIWIKMLQTRVDPNASSPVGLWNRANKHAVHGNLGEAVRMYSAALAVNPELYQAHFGRGLVRLKQGMLDRALEDFDATVRIAPRWAPGLIHRGVVHEGMGHPVEALEDFRQATEVDPRDATAYYHLGRLLEEEGEPLAALESYEQAIRLNPKALLRKLLKARMAVVKAISKSRPKGERAGIKLRKRLW